MSNPGHLHSHHHPGHIHPAARSRPSILRLGVAARLAAALGVIALIWGGVAWAIF
jgi:hypothetical protein